MQADANTISIHPIRMDLQGGETFDYEDRKDRSKREHAPSRWEEKRRRSATHA